MFDTLTPRSTTGEFETMLCARPDPSGSCWKPGPAHTNLQLT